METQERDDSLRGVVKYVQKIVAAHPHIMRVDYYFYPVLGFKLMYEVSPNEYTMVDFEVDKILEHFPDYRDVVYYVLTRLYEAEKQYA